jgi:hypothetical protein
MMNHNLVRGLAIVFALGLNIHSSHADDKPVITWEYRVVTKDQVIALGKNDLSVGLNKLGTDGWELVVIDGSYIFKRPKVQHDKEIAELKLTISLLLRDQEQQKERLAWSQRMLKKGFIGEAGVAAERIRLERYELALEKSQKELESLTAPPKEPMPLPPQPTEGKSKK